MVVRKLAEICLLIPVLAGCSGEETVLDSVQRDHETRRDVNVALFREDRFSGVHVLCEKGVVTLEGSVRSEKDAKEAEEIAAGCSGVRRVVSRIEVREK